MTLTVLEAGCEQLVRLADSCLVLGHRMSEWIGKAPILEEELALTNIGLDLVGQARSLYEHALSFGVISNKSTADELVYLRDAQDYRNLLIVERENGDFALTMVRQLLFSAYAVPIWRQLAKSIDKELAGISARAERETAYHLLHSSEWIIRMGDGTTESRDRVEKAFSSLWRFTGEMFEEDEVDRITFSAGIGFDLQLARTEWEGTLRTVLAEATLTSPQDCRMVTGGRIGRHTEHLGHLLAEMQFLQRAYPGLSW
jgi:ring-1,2-phenylacetyl-CoA epoxidase subunit PaaC